MDLEGETRIKTILAVMQVVGNFLSDEELNALVDTMFADLGVDRPEPKVVNLHGGEAA